MMAQVTAAADEVTTCARPEILYGHNIAPTMRSNVVSFLYHPVAMSDTVS